MIRRPRHPLPALAAAVALLALAAAAHACPVCGAEGTARSRAAFFGGTMLLSLLPLGMIGGGLWWVARRFPGGLEGQFEVTDSTAPPDAPRPDPGDREPR